MCMHKIIPCICVYVRDKITGRSVSIKLVVYKKKHLKVISYEEFLDVECKIILLPYCLL